MNDHSSSHILWISGSLVTAVGVGSGVGVSVGVGATVGVGSGVGAGVGVGVGATLSLSPMHPENSTASNSATSIMDFNFIIITYRTA
ncbi:MAG: hypothetical protein C4B59_03265 [Candidatus Methanogaster sp.]|uniref:Uncharacterized protein n=1 Tax=Candidatus Methanogaster sp. TaxID=3386292 RepID=A0AC61L5E3_9EURY|nr:MAG: hypothetical protein C4B59_03265 [ANME-2 cluster archaeon]